MQKIETVVFDLGGVLIDWNPRYVYDTVFKTKNEVDFFLENVCTGAWNAEQDRGRSFEDGVKMKIEEYPEYAKEIPLYHKRWTEMVKGEISDTVLILNELYEKSQLRLYALTNWSDETFPYAWDNFEFLRKFEGILVSGKEKLIKPDLAIYNLLLNRYDIEAGKSVFIDDSLKNVEAARASGMNAIHFQSPQQLRENLVSLGVI